MIEPVSIPILLDLELEEEELDLSVEEAEEYAAQIGSLITISEVYGGLPSGGNSGDIIIKNSEEDYDASWYAPASVVEDGNGLPVTSDAVYDAVSVKYTKPSDGIPADDLAERAISSRIWWTNGQIIQRLTMKTILISQLNNNTPAPDEVPLVPRVGDIVVGPKSGVTDGVPRYLYIISGFFKGAPSGDLAILQDFALSDYNGAYIGPLKVSELQNDSGFGTYSKPSDGIPASDLASDVHLIPSGGTIGQVLKKISDNDWDIEWGGPIEDSTQIWWTDRVQYSTQDGVRTYWASKYTLRGKDGVVAAADDYVYGPHNSPLTTADPDALFVIDRIQGSYAYLTFVCSIKGTDGVGVPSGGTTGQVLKKASGTDYDTEWANESAPITSVNGQTGAVVLNASDVGAGTYSKPSGGIPASDLASDVHLIPAGGTVGQLIMKKSAGDYDIEWVSPANTAEQDNTLPITSAGVYMEIGNINALLSTI